MTKRLKVAPENENKKIRASDLPDFDIANYLTDKASIAEYLRQELEEQTLLESEAGSVSPVAK